MADFINTADVDGSEVLTDSFIDRSITTFADYTVQTVGMNAFRKCIALVSVNLPSVTTVGKTGFYGCSALISADFTSVTKFETNVFYGCPLLTTLILRGMVVPTGSGVCAGTPIASGTGYIYVPAALVDSYKAATNWSTYANQIRAIEDYPEICG